MVTVGQTTQGYQWAYYKSVTTSSSTYATSPDIFVNLAMPITGFRLVLLSGTSCEYSFNGTDAHGALDGTVDKIVQFDNRAVSKIFVRSSGGGSITVKCEAWVAR